MATAVDEDQRAVDAEVARVELIDGDSDGVPDFVGLGLPYRRGTPAAFDSTGGDDTPVAG